MINISAEYYANRDEAFEKTGSSWFFDAIFLFVFPPLAILSLLANLISYRIFSSSYFVKKPLYTYLKATCLNSSAINLIYMFSFLCESRRFLAFTNAEWSIFFKCYVKLQLVLLAYFYGCMLDIVLALERLSELTNFKHAFNRVSSVRVCVWLFLACLLISLPFLFIFEPKAPLVFRNTRTNSTELVYFYAETAFATQPSGKLLKMGQALVRDVLTLVLLIGLNVSTLILFRRNYNLNHHDNEFVTMTTNKRTSSEMTLLFGRGGHQGQGQGGEERSTSLLFLIGVDGGSRRRATTTNNNVMRNNNNLMIRNRSSTVVHVRVLKVNTMLTKMVLTICALSTCEHILLILSLQLFPIFVYNKYRFAFLANASVFFMHSAKFFVYFSCNKIFKKQFSGILMAFFRKNT